MTRYLLDTDVIILALKGETGTMQLLIRLARHRRVIQQAWPTSVPPQCASRCRESVTKSKSVPNSRAKARVQRATISSRVAAMSRRIGTTVTAIGVMPAVTPRSGFVLGGGAGAARLRLVIRGRGDGVAHLLAHERNHRAQPRGGPRRVP